MLGQRDKREWDEDKDEQIEIGVGGVETEGNWGAEGTGHVGETPLGESVQVKSRETGQFPWHLRQPPRTVTGLPYLSVSSAAWRYTGWGDPLPKGVERKRDGVERSR